MLSMFCSPLPSPHVIEPESFFILLTATVHQLSSISCIIYVPTAVIKHHEKKQLTEAKVYLGLWIQMDKSPSPLQQGSMTASSHDNWSSKLRVHKWMDTQVASREYKMIRAWVFEAMQLSSNNMLLPTTPHLWSSCKQSLHIFKCLKQWAHLIQMTTSSSRSYSVSSLGKIFFTLFWQTSFF